MADKDDINQRDILIELRADMRHVRSSIDHFQKSDTKQWEKIDDLNARVKGHDGDIGFLTKGFWVVAGSIVTAAATVAVWVVTK